jgi:hypothetical protein
MKIKYLPEPIKKRALECQKEQGNEPNEELELDADGDGGGFYWIDTKERKQIWNGVNQGYYEAFYSFHGPNIIRLTRSQIAEKFGITGDFEIID